MIHSYVLKRPSIRNGAPSPKPKLDPTQCKYCRQHYTEKGLARHQKSCKEKHSD